ncbi:MAG TPA: DsbA family protein [Acidimicrobiales bacterium]|nr:DsbA family protein [Acidimicrobiales bacterium]
MVDTPAVNPLVISPVISPGTIVVWSDLACPWAHLAVYRLHQARDSLDLAGAVRFDHRAFVLEVANSRPTPKRILDAEIPVVGALDPGAGWQMWQEDLSCWPVTTLPALEAVQAAKEQGLAAAEQLDRALRVALFGGSRCISLRSVILEVAGECEQVDEDRLRDALDDGRARRMMMDQHAAADDAGVKGSPHLFLPDGTEAHNPGVEFRWEGEHGKGFPVVTADNPTIYTELLQRAAALAP